jgi:TonB family protein
LENIALVIKCRPADAHRRVLRRLKELGLVRVFLGVESATERGLFSLERNQSVQDSERALETCSELDISAQFTLMTFNPDATLDTLRSDAAFMRRFCGNPLNFCRAEIYAGTPLEKRMIELGRARGDYLARVYSLSDAAADLACNLSLDLFGSRCWSNGSLMQNAIGLDHTAAVAKRFCKGPQGVEIFQRVAAWLRAVNLDTVNLLDEVISISASGAASTDAGLRSALFALNKREVASRSQLDSAGWNLRTELERLRPTRGPSPTAQLPRSLSRLARQAAVAVLAIGIPATSACGYGVSEMAPAPLKQAETPPLPSTGGQEATLAGKVTNAAGAVVTNVTITITNADTAQARTLKTNEAGQYAASDLPAGRYTVKAEAPGFKTTMVTGIALKAGDQQRTDIRLEIGNWGCCEYAAVPLKTLPVKTLPEGLSEMQKPFTYTVGQADDHSTFWGIAKLVYGDSKMWVQIFEANRNVVQKPGVLPFGTPILIPPRRRLVPKLISKVTPDYPAAAAKEHVSGDVVMDVTLKEDGTVEQVNVIDGNPLLVEAAIHAVKQWRYKPLIKRGIPVVKLVVVVSFEEGGKVQ